MGVYDRAARLATEAEPLAVMQRLGALAKMRWSFGGWTPTQTSPRTHERDQTADRCAIMEDLDKPGNFWLPVLEVQATHEADKIDDLLAEVAQFRRNLRHGPERQGKYRVLPVLVYLGGECPQEEAVLDMTVPGGQGIRHAPLLWEIAKDQARHALDDYEHERTTWDILFWIGLMAGADDEEVVKRWLELVRALPAAQQPDVLGVGLLFAGLAGRGQLWRRILGEWNMTESPILNEWIEKANAEVILRTRREALLLVLNARFPGQVPADIIDTIKSQPSSDLLNEWLPEATLRSLDEFRAYLRR